MCEQCCKYSNDDIISKCAFDGMHTYAVETSTRIEKGVSESYNGLIRKPFSTIDRNYFLLYQLLRVQWGQGRLS